MKRVDGHNNLYKDPDSGVIVNRETSDRARYRVAKQQALANIEARSELAVLKEELKELSDVKDELNELKELVKQLLK